MKEKPIDDLFPSQLFLIPILVTATLILAACRSDVDQSFIKAKTENIPGEPTALEKDTEIEVETTKEKSDSSEEVNKDEVKIVNETSLANVVSVGVSGIANAYQFSIGISSPDTGCQQYADWWEVITEDGKLLYRRILLHSHVNEQPFTRSGGPVEIDPDTIVFIRAHLNPGGYGGLVMKGSAQAGFGQTTLDRGFAAGLEMEPPLPSGCDF